MDDDALNQNPQRTTGGKDSPAAAPASRSPLVIPDHTLIRCIGRGAYGEVWLARNLMQVYRAVKIIYRKNFREARPFERELAGIRRYEPVSRSFDGFIDVLHVGSNAEHDCFYYVMELGDDQDFGQDIDPETYVAKTLGKEIERHGKLPFKNCLQLGLDVSQALAKLHENGLVHRDVKPSNIIFVHGVAKLADIGLVADVQETMSFVGTEGFVPPEGPGRPQADIYGLGKVLYEASTGKDRQEFPELPTLLDELPEQQAFLELNEVILNACKNNPAQRYASASEMHADLLLLAGGKSVKRLKDLERKWARFKKLAGAGLIALAAAAIFSVEGFREWKHATEAHRREVTSAVAAGNRAVESGDLTGALPYFAEALELDRDDPAAERNHQLRFASALNWSPRLTQMWFGPKLIRSVDLSPDGRKILVVPWNHQSQIFDAATGQPVTPKFGQNWNNFMGAFSPDGKMVITANADRTARAWRASDGTQVLKLIHPAAVECAHFSPDGRRIVTACKDGGVRVWDAQTLEVQMSFLQHTSTVNYVTFSADGRLIATTSDDCTTRIWDAVTGIPVCPPLPHRTGVNRADFSPDGSLLVTAGSDKAARVWEVATGRQIMPDLEHSDTALTGRFSPDGRWILTTCMDKTVRLWDATTHQPLNPNPILRHTDGVQDAVFGNDGRTVVTACFDGTVRVWDLARTGPPSAPLHGTLSDDGLRALVHAAEGLRVCDTATGEPLSPAFHSAFALKEARLNATGSCALTVSMPPTETAVLAVEVWETATARRIAPPLCFTNGVWKFRLGPDGRRLLACNGKVAQTWIVPTGRPLSAPVLHDDDINIIASGFSPDGKLVVTANGRLANVWNADTGTEKFKPLAHSAMVKSARFSPDGSRLATGCYEQFWDKCFAQVWDVATGRPLGLPLQRGDRVLSVSFSPDGRRVVTANADHAAQIWNATTGQPLNSALEHADAVLAAEFSADGRWLVTACNDGSARVWSADTGEPLTPPLRQPTALSRAHFLHDSRSIVTKDDDDNIRTWILAWDEKPVADCANMARLMAGKIIFPSAGTNAVSAKPLQNLWETMRAKYHGDFAVTKSEITGWQENQARECENNGEWFAAEFHLRRLASARPDDPEIARRLQEAAAHLKISH